MTLYDERLSSIAAQIKNGVAPPAEQLVTFLDWFGVTRRGWRNVSSIRTVLQKYEVETRPDFENADYYGQISFTAAPKAEVQQKLDPTVRLSELPAASRSPVTVAPDETLQRAVSQMLAKDYSQLPVVTGQRDVKGLVSWKSIGSRLALGRSCTYVRDCMDTAHVLSSSASLSEAIAVVAEKDCLLVQAVDRSICGIVTATDLNEQFLVLAEPFLLVGEVEKGVRNLLNGKFSADELIAARAPGNSLAINGLADLTFGEYERLLQNDKHWEKLELKIDRREFCGHLEKIREIRNDVMHFSPDGPAPEDTRSLREFAAFLRRLRELGAA